MARPEGFEPPTLCLEGSPRRPLSVFGAGLTNAENFLEFFPPTAGLQKSLATDSLGQRGELLVMDEIPGTSVFGGRACVRIVLL